MCRLKQRFAHGLGRPRWRRIGAGLSFIAASLVASYAGASSAAGAAGHGELVVNWWRWDTAAPPVGWFILDFILFVGLLVYFTRRPLRTAFLARHTRIKKAITDAEERHKQAALRYEEYRAKLANAEAESQQHVERGKADGTHERDQLIAAAKEYAERLRLDAKAVVEQEVEKAKARLRQRAVTDLLADTERVLRESLGDQDRARLLDEAIATLEKDAAAPGPSTAAKGRDAV